MVSFNAANVRHLWRIIMGMFVLVEVAPNGAQTIQSVFQAESLEAASAYAEQKNVSELGVTAPSREGFPLQCATKRRRATNPFVRARPVFRSR